MWTDQQMTDGTVDPAVTGEESGAHDVPASDDLTGCESDWDGLVGTCTGCMKGPSPLKTDSKHALQATEMKRDRRAGRALQRSDEGFGQTMSKGEDRHRASGTRASLSPTKGSNEDRSSQGQHVPGNQQQEHEHFTESTLEELVVQIKTFEGTIQTLKTDNKMIHRKLEEVLSKQALTDHFIKIMQFDIKQLRDRYSMQEEDGVRFHGSDNILSNFYLCNIHFDEWDFHSTEHLYQYFKALFHGEKALADEISSAAHAGVAKSISKRITVTPKWHSAKYEVMANVLRVKTGQCKEFMETLKGTGQRKLIHDIPDPVWGIGPNGMGRNLNGHLLELVRSELLDSDDLETKAMEILSAKFPYPKKESAFKEKLTDFNWRKGDRNMSGISANTINISAVKPIPCRNAKQDKQMAK